MGMANVLNEEKRQQVLALGRLGWSLRRIQQATRIRRETASAYLKAAGMFAEEKPTLLPLPLEPFRYYQYGERIVHLDGCFEVEAAYYGAPPGWIGRVLRVQWDRLPRQARPDDPTVKHASLAEKSQLWEAQMSWRCYRERLMERDFRSANLKFMLPALRKLAPVF